MKTLARIWICMALIFCAIGLYIGTFVAVFAGSVMCGEAFGLASLAVVVAIIDEAIHGSESS